LDNYDIVDEQAEFLYEDKVAKQKNLQEQENCDIVSTDAATKGVDDELS
jgi:hypothetical protein